METCCGFGTIIIALPLTPCFTGRPSRSEHTAIAARLFSATCCFSAQRVSTPLRRLSRKDISYRPFGRRKEARSCHHLKSYLWYVNLNTFPFPPFRPPWARVRIDSLTTYHSSCETLLLFSPQVSHLCTRYYNQDLHYGPLQ